MSFSPFIPKPGRYKKSTKDLAIGILAYEHPLTIQGLYERIRKEYGVSVSYPAIRKGVKELAGEKIVLQSGRQYGLNPEWISRMQAFVNGMHASYLQGSPPPEKTEVGENVFVYSVNSIYEAENLWGTIIMDWAGGLDRKVQHYSTFQAYHIWTLLFNLKWEEAQLLKLQEINAETRSLIYSRTFLDSIAAKFYNDSGVPTRTVDDPSFTRGCELGTYDDLIIQLYHPPEIARELDRFYMGVRRLEDMNLSKLSELAKRSVKLKLTVLRNADMANQIRNSLGRQFRSGKRS
jgi:hypothetical protein